MLLRGVGYSSVDCTEAPGGGCSCLAKIQQSGSAGVVLGDPQTTGRFTNANNLVNLDSGTSYASCASAIAMTWTPQSQNPTTTGTIVFQSGDAPATGGVGGAAGKTGSGGASGASSTTSSGGMTSSGGTTSSGGMAGIGGAAGAAGTWASAAAAGTGGMAGGGGGTTSYEGPCDIYRASGTPCAAAYSTVRLLAGDYGGPLYQIRIGGSSSGSGGTLKDIGLIQGGVFADGPAQDTPTQNPSNPSAIWDYAFGLLDEHGERHSPIRDQGRRRPIRRPDYGLRRKGTRTLESAGRRRPRYRRR